MLDHVLLPCRTVCCDTGGKSLRLILTECPSRRHRRAPLLMASRMTCCSTLAHAAASETDMAHSGRSARRRSKISATRGARASAIASISCCSSFIWLSGWNVNAELARRPGSRGADLLVLRQQRPLPQTIGRTPAGGGRHRTIADVRSAPRWMLGIVSYPLPSSKSARHHPAESAAAVRAGRRAASPTPAPSRPVRPKPRKGLRPQGRTPP